MKVKLTANKETVTLIANMLAKVYDLPVSLVTQENVYKSIAMDLADKFEAKSRALKKNADLLNAKKKSDITLKFHEAWALHEVIHDLLQIIELNNYQQSLIIQFLQQVDQKII